MASFSCPPSVFAQLSLSSNLPIVVLETPGDFIPDEPKILAHMGIIYNGEGERNALGEAFNHYDGNIRIERRGSSSQMFPKEQFGLELQTSAGADTAVALLGLPPEEDWILFGPYNDKSLMRDVLAYKMARDMGRYAPRTRYCELVWNGDYRGVYVLIEKIKRDRNRLHISKLEPEDVSGDDVTGGYILKIDKSTGSNSGGFASAYIPPNAALGQQIFFQYEYPSGDQLTAEQQDYIQRYVGSMEEVLASPDFNDPQQGYRAYIDVGSFVDFMIVNEASKNVDGYRLSTFLHKERNSEGGKIRMGPVWDFNLGFGNANYCTSGEPQGFVHHFNAVCPADNWLVPFWWKRLLQDSFYKRELSSRWKELRQGKFSTPVLHAFVDSVASVLAAESAPRNFERWDVLGQWIWPNLVVEGSYQGEVQYLKNWITQRMNWLDGQWGDGFVTSAEGISNINIAVYSSLEEEVWFVEGVAVHDGTLQATVNDMSGRTVMRVATPIEGSKFNTRISNNGIEPGLYLMTVTLGKSRVVSKVVKVR